MTENKWTPGPWSVPHAALDDTTCNCKYVLAEYGGMGSIAEISVCENMEMSWGDDIGPDYEQAKANAHLIAAAPEMADYIKVRADSGDPEAQQIMAKARGETK